MTNQHITIGSILSLIGALSLLFCIIDFSSDLMKNPSDESNIEKVANKTIEVSTPPQVDIIIKFAPYGVIEVILTMAIIIFGNKIMNYKIFK